ncbi:hypothetical protein CALCODRAFT_450940 [Calocera cornea HHB12733]|uniref:Family A G protein-coupled receptor-like protein n=1 Tax=Calocera cornea HHB12733 TaxID=1353952 RepID=A0A165H5A2_9BASI|nr:hypothetical protein CALCODRAFT_450940 [Calocera cornea HHB12733]
MAPSSFLPRTLNTPVPLGMQDLAVIQPALSFLLIGVIFSTLLLPLLIALVSLSTPASRRHAVFGLNVFAIGLGVLAGILHSYVMIHTILSPSNPLQPQTGLAFTLLMSFTPFVVECILLLRLIAVFPPKKNPLWKTCLVLAIPVITKVVRLVLLALFAQCYTNNICSVASISAEIADNDVRFAVLYVKTTWFLQLIDNTYVSVVFLWQLRKQAAPKHRIAAWTTQARLQGLFYIALTSYLFPTLCGVVELILIYAAHSLVPATCVLFFDIYISIFGVAFATVWTTGISWIDDHSTAPGYSPAQNLNGSRGASQKQQTTVDSDRTAVSRSNHKGRSTGDLSESNDMEMEMEMGIKVVRDEEVVVERIDSMAEFEAQIVDIRRLPRAGSALSYS